MQKQLIGLTVLSSLILGMTAAHAAPPTAELKVKGKLSVPTCNVMAPDGGVYDLGKISATNIKSGVATTALTPITKTWTITCDADTYLTYTPQDNRSGSESASGGHNYGLGLVNGTGKIGYYTVKMSNAKIDNVASNIVCIQPGQAADCTTMSNVLKGELQGWSNADKSLKAGKTFSADLEVSAVLAGSTTMAGPITEDSKIDGSMTMNFAFGI
ncbi:DUF1120 domain-containing protein [Yersinia enterocolitica]|uniref:DUF1120 domain-containing protein n=1 Tax=Yersinia hibernica TaxID=2339259 RepID=A0ABX5R6T5_9GAMM|nr:MULTISPECIES: DUF1120 domain-containing protein [Yersinia]EKN3638160.1 DUF1120 domain-containing protein [Yersinia enterocolitica]EKN4883303.1 DUF1120 domain-containing protein [Yersinia enterocolitica]EKN6003782.1 DUF1120 domain-containing protein [Yersinia enterocolitica]EKN6092310.1 DUF1120 domain-containing protein [Yersinia enterocolitica]EKN6127995.1 DUF1120 domain-containing protein [Yersinia enterocolitica]